MFAFVKMPFVMKTVLIMDLEPVSVVKVLSNIAEVVSQGTIARLSVSLTEEETVTALLDIRNIMVLAQFVLLAKFRLMAIAFIPAGSTKSLTLRLENVSASLILEDIMESVILVQSTSSLKMVTALLAHLKLS